MKNKIKLLSLISALAIGAAFAFTACGKSEVGEHDHDWNEGTVTTESTCYSEGLRTYNCKVEGCKQTKTEPIAKIAHSWDGGEVTKQAKCNEEGVKTYTCTVDGCGKTKEEPIDKTAHRYGNEEITKVPSFLTKGKKTLTCLDCGDVKTESIEARADFSEQFYTDLTERSNWSYGYANSYDATTGEVDFVGLEDTENGAWTSEETKIGKGYVYSENNAVIAYSFNEAIPELVQTNVSISFIGEESTTRLNAYLIINGECVETIEKNTKDWSYKTEDAIDISQGDTFYLVFENKGEGKAGGSLAFTLTAPCVHVWNGGEVTTEPTETSEGERTYTCVQCETTRTESIPKLVSTVFNGASFKEDFELNTNGEFNGWQVGVVNYNFDNETFEFTKITALNGSGDAYNNNPPWIEIKSDWMAVNGMMGFAYSFNCNANVHVKFNLQGVSADGRFSLRWSLNADGEAQWGGAGHEIAFDRDITVVAGDVLYLLVNKDAGGDQNTFEIILTDKDRQPEPEPQTYAITFAGGEGATGTAPTVENKAEGAKFNLPANTFTKEGYTFAGWSDGEDLYQPEDEYTMSAKAVTFTAQWTANQGTPEPQTYTITFAGGEGATGTAPTIDNKAEGAKFNLPANLFTKEGYTFAGWSDGEDVYQPDDEYTMPAKAVMFTAQWTANQVTPEPEFSGANFAEDFELNENGEFNGWSVGVVNYDFGPETFGFTKITTLNGAGDAYNNGDPWMEIKGDWMASNGMMGFAYRFNCSENIFVRFNLHCSAENGNYSLRWAIKDKEGNIKNADGKAQWGGGGHDIAFKQTISVEKDDVLYLLLNKDGDGDTSNFDITLTKYGKLADFGEDFELNANGEFNGWSVGRADYHFDGTETFDFIKVSDLNGNNDAYHSGDPWIDINGGFIASKAIVAIAYTFTEAANIFFDINVTCKDDGKCSIRWALSGSGDGKGKWGGSGDNVKLTEDFTVEEGDVLYILIGFEADGNDDRSDQKDFTLTLSEKVS